MKILTIKPNDAGQRLDKFLFKALPALPKSQVYKYLRLKRVKLNGRRCEGSDRLSSGDRLELYINDEYFTPPLYPFLAAPADITTVYEDENILLLDKRPGLVVHEDESGGTDTLINRIQHYLFDRGEYSPGRENSFAPALCNRIDRNTGGIVIAAKNFESLQILSEKIRNREITKKYLCLVHDTPKEAAAVLQGFHTKNTATNTARISASRIPGSKTVITKYRVLASANGLSLLEVELLTGRTHQIRAHMASIGHPIAGDSKYGLNRMNKAYPYKFQALYSYKISFDFKSAAGRLDYLRNREFTVPAVPFASEYGYYTP